MTLYSYRIACSDIVDHAQPNLKATMGALWGRRLAMRLSLMPVPRERGLALFSFWRTLPVRQKVRSVAGSLRRILVHRVWRPVRMEIYDDA